MTRYPHIFILCCALMLSACNALPPWADWMEKGPPPGREYTPLYVEGWKGGCHSGISANANAWYQLNYGFKQDPILAQDIIYYKGWKDAFDYCSRYVYQRNNKGYF